MKKTPSYIIIILMAAAIYWGFYTSTPSYDPDTESTLNEFSVDRALAHVQQLSKEPHALGFPAHQSAKMYVFDQLNKMGLSPVTQTGYALGKGNNLSKPTNIIAKIEGTEQGKSLLVLSHYDSNPHSSLGASDAASGVATILEGVRAFLSKKIRPTNDIIILFTDSEELGLNGAELFANQHPWAKNIGLVLNFEARGSGGPSYTFIETNRGNQNLISEFIAARPEHPMANSLYYSIYKMLPNDTDLTVFRENLDIDGFNFAFIDDHFDYHTAQDSFERLDRTSLAHQGSYLMPLLEHFSQANLNQLKSLNDHVYFNMPFFHVVTYPFDWIMPLLFIAILFFVALLIRGIQKKSLSLKKSLLGFIPLLVTLLLNGLVGYFAWPFLKWVYPSYNDILHGFTYNGYLYILAFALFSLAICMFVYHRYHEIGIRNLLVAPLVLWLVICTLVAIYLPGASFFIVPVFCLLAMWLTLINQKDPHTLLLLFLALPALWLYTPFIKGFAVGLGLKMLVASTLMLTLTFFLISPVLASYRFSKGWSKVFFTGFFICLIVAHIDSGFDEDRKRPSSLVYVSDNDSKKAYWGSYDNVLTEWNEDYFINQDSMPLRLKSKILSSKYGTAFQQVSEAPKINLEKPKIETLKDTIIGEKRIIEVCLTPQRVVNRLDVYLDGADLLTANVNGQELSTYDLPKNSSGRLFTHYLTPDEYTELQLSMAKNQKPKLTFFESSNDLLTNQELNIEERPEHQMPMPFVVNDAIINITTVSYE
ncbi:peptidase M28 [Euzebyella marina]|uniref:Vacuolar membrane protease n=1 Tax=Euzebyella marina TaxID=1761453 RepID=A0A3G2L2A4_9FLAO|nr:M28 family peptidase [Euzebyella marina]AYN66389.1 peptidase M28 [Euzebyella marina]